MGSQGATKSFPTQMTPPTLPGLPPAPRLGPFSSSPHRGCGRGGRSSGGRWVRRWGDGGAGAGDDSCGGGGGDGRGATSCSVAWSFQDVVKVCEGTWRLGWMETLVYVSLSTNLGNKVGCDPHNQPFLLCCFGICTWIVVSMRCFPSLREQWLSREKFIWDVWSQPRPNQDPSQNEPEQHETLTIWYINYS